MKQLILLPLLILSSFASHSQTFVDASATGSNDGSNWANAYTELHVAITNASVSDSIFVAEGTYFPDTSLGRAAHFLIDQHLNIYGGFKGTEISLATRDSTAGPTILEGDLLGDDVSGDVFNFRSDNLYQIMRISASVSNATILDLLTFHGGYADGPAQDTRNGGAIMIFGPISITDCQFVGHYSEGNGGALAIEGIGASSSSVKNCTFSNNYAAAFGGGMYASNVSDVLIDSCDFKENEAVNNGGGIRLIDTDAVLSHCVFSNNDATRTGGGLSLWAFTRSAVKVDVSDCSFTDNLATFGGGIWMGGTTDDNEFQILNCDFVDNEATYLLPNPGAEPSGGGVGVEFAAFGNPTRNHILVKNCLFRGNKADSYGGGLRVAHNGGTDNLFFMRNCSIENNSSQISGGGLQIDASADYAFAQVDRCSFSNNRSPEGLGIYVGKIFPGPFTTPQRIEFSNCLLSGHQNSGISNPVIGIYYTDLSLVNCTIAKNEAEAMSVRTGGSIALKNTILDNPGYRSYFDTLITFPAPERITSFGGNITSDSTLKFRLGATDFYNLDPLLDSLTLSPLLGSPCVDQGVTIDSAYDFDLLGNARIQGLRIDIGAIESPFTTSIWEEKHASLQMNLFPNPAQELLFIELENLWRGSVKFEILTIAGQVVNSSSVVKLGETVQYSFSLAHLPAGTYFLSTIYESTRINKQFVKLD